MKFLMVVALVFVFDSIPICLEFFVAKDSFVELQFVLYAKNNLNKGFQWKDRGLL